jgi:hypothetical protein
MEIALIVVMAVATVFLGVRFYVKLRRATGTSPEEEMAGRRSSRPLPPDLQNLKIDSPPDDTFDASNSAVPPNAKKDPKSHTTP